MPKWGVDQKVQIVIPIILNAGGFVCTLNTKVCTRGIMKDDRCLVEEQNCLRGYYCPEGSKGGHCDNCPNVFDDCKTDKDCYPTTVCNQSLACRLGKCAPNCTGSCLSYYDNCDSDDDCCPSMGCTLYTDGHLKCFPQSVDTWQCSTDSGCVDGFLCVKTKCAPCTYGASCDSNSACCGDLQCVDGACYTGWVGQQCGKKDEDCGSGEVECCENLPCTGGKCTPCSYLGHPCDQKDQNCCAGYVCNAESKCERCSDGGNCPSDEDGQGADRSSGAGSCNNPKNGSEEGICTSCEDLCTNNLTCTTKSDCCTNHYCSVNSECTDCIPKDCSCFESQSCCDGYFCDPDIGNKCTPIFLS